MWECTECYASVDENRKNRHRAWHATLKSALEDLEAMIRRK